MKTQNVLISGDGGCKISDLGLSKLIDPRFSLITAKHLGTIAYMAPEHVLRGRHGLASDIWALGIILWEVRSENCL